MLVLTRQAGHGLDSILHISVPGGDGPSIVTLIVSDASNGQVRLIVDAPANVRVISGEAGRGSLPEDGPPLERARKKFHRALARSGDRIPQLKAAFKKRSAPPGVRTDG